MVRIRFSMHMHEEKRLMMLINIIILPDLTLC